MSLKSGTCPSCGQSEVFCNVKSRRRGERGRFVISPFKWLYIDAYVCSKCGKFEEYIDNDTLQDEVAQEKMKTNWKKVFKK